MYSNVNKVLKSEDVLHISLRLVAQNSRNFIVQAKVSSLEYQVGKSWMRTKRVQIVKLLFDHNHLIDNMKK